MSAGPSEPSFLFLAVITLCAESGGLATELFDPRTRERGTLGIAVRDPFLPGAEGEAERLFLPEDSSDEAGWDAAGLDPAGSCSVLGASSEDSSSIAPSTGASSEDSSSATFSTGASF